MTSQSRITMKFGENMMNWSRIILINVFLFLYSSSWCKVFDVYAIAMRGQKGDNYLTGIL